MTGATLMVSWESRGRKLRFMLQRSGVAAGMEEIQSLSPELLRQLGRSLEQFTECLRGQHSDEPVFQLLGQLLFRQLMPVAIGEQVRGLDEPLTILTQDATLPWEILHDQSDFLALRLCVARQLLVYGGMAPYIVGSHAAEEPDGFAALVVADPTDDLPGARQEGEALAELFRARGDCDLLVGRAATWEKIQFSLLARPYSVIHYCGHIDYDFRERRSAIRLPDGRLSADEILRAFRGRPVVFLNACYSDVGFSGSAAARATGGLAPTQSFAHAFLLGNALGQAAAVVGAQWKIPDEPEMAGQEFACFFYQRLLAGTAIGEALRTSRHMARDRQWGPRVWGPYVLYGDPLLVPFRAPAAKVDDPGAPSAPSPVGTAPVVSPPVAPPPIVPPPHEPRDDRPALDTAARRVFLIALREMEGMGQAGLGTMHLLLGLCEADVPSLRRALAERGVDPAVVTAEARQAAIRYVAEKEGSDFGISENVARTLKHASRRARAQERETIAGEDLFAGLLACRNCSATTILRRHGIPSDLLDRKGPSSSRPLPGDESAGRAGRTKGGESPVPRVGPLGPEDCDPEAWQVLFGAARRAAQEVRGGGLVGTPHLFAALLAADQGATARALRRFGIDPRSAALQSRLPREPRHPPELAPAVPCSENVEGILADAQASAAASDIRQVTDAGLLRAFLARGGGHTGPWLRRAGLFEPLVWSRLFRDDGELDLTRFDAALHTVFERALRCTRDKGHEVLSRSHLLYALLLAGTDLPRKLREQKLDPETLADLLFGALPAGTAGRGVAAVCTGAISRGLAAVLDAAETAATSAGAAQVGELHLLRALLRDGGGAGQLLIQYGVRWNRLL